MYEKVRDPGSFGQTKKTPTNAQGWKRLVAEAATKKVSSGITTSRSNMNMDKKSRTRLQKVEKSVEEIKFLVNQMCAGMNISTEIPAIYI